MKAVRGKNKFANVRPAATFPSSIGRMIILSALPLVFSACVHWPDVATDCESYGVTESHTPMGNVVHLKALYRDELNVHCAGVDHSNAAIGTEISGCVIAEDNGKLNAYYWVGDRCAMNHEICHAKHGPGHTERYLQELKDGVPMPYCPRNQLALKW